MKTKYIIAGMIILAILFAPYTVEISIWTQKYAGQNFLNFCEFAEECGLSLCEDPIEPKEINGEKLFRFIFHKDGSNPYDIMATFNQRGVLVRFRIFGGRDCHRETFQKVEKFLAKVLTAPPFNSPEILRKNLGDKIWSLCKSDQPYKYENFCKEIIYRERFGAANILADMAVTKTAYSVAIEYY